MKPYRHHPILECGEALVSLRHLRLVLTEPHPYKAFGAPYHGACPWQARAQVVEALERAITELDQRRPGYRFRIFDAYRPNRIQAFMVGHEFRMVSGGRPPEECSEEDAENFWTRTYRIWAEPSEDPASPPPHSTGAALDLTICDPEGIDLPMGSPIDENSDRSLPDYFETRDPLLHANRILLLDVMTASGFERHAEEWWHFSLGDQMWAWTRTQRGKDTHEIARYGRADLFA